MENKKIIGLCVVLTASSLLIGRDGGAELGEFPWRKELREFREREAEKREQWKSDAQRALEEQEARAKEQRERQEQEAREKKIKEREEQERRAEQAAREEEELLELFADVEKLEAVGAKSVEQMILEAQGWKTTIERLRVRIGLSEATKVLKNAQEEVQKDISDQLTRVNKIPEFELARVKAVKAAVKPGVEEIHVLGVETLVQELDKLVLIFEPLGAGVAEVMRADVDSKEYVKQLDAHMSKLKSPISSAALKTARKKHEELEKRFEPMKTNLYTNKDRLILIERVINNYDPKQQQGLPLLGHAVGQNSKQKIENAIALAQEINDLATKKPWLYKRTLAAKRAEYKRLVEDIAKDVDELVRISLKLVEIKD